jgi:hypothetical protein
MNGFVMQDEDRRGSQSSSPRNFFRLHETNESKLHRTFPELSAYANTMHVDARTCSTYSRIEGICTTMQERGRELNQSSSAESPRRMANTPLIDARTRVVLHVSILLGKFTRGLMKFTDALVTMDRELPGPPAKRGGQNIAPTTIHVIYIVGCPDISFAGLGIGQTYHPYVEDTMSTSISWSFISGAYEKTVLIERELSSHTIASCGGECQSTTQQSLIPPSVPHIDAPVICLSGFKA